MQMKSQLLTKTLTKTSIIFPVWLSIVVLIYFLSETELIANAKSSPGLIDANILYVAPGGYCGSALPCFAAIQDAVDLAASGDIIKIAGGVYAVDSDMINEVVFIRQPISLLGGYSIENWENPLPQSNISRIDGRYKRIGIYIDAMENDEVKIDGFRVINSRHGIYIKSGYAMITNSVVSNNRIDQGKGAGIFIDYSGRLLLEKSIVEENLITNGTFGEGAGLAAMGEKVILKENIFRNNIIYGGGYAVGAGVWGQNTDLILERNKFQNNLLSPASYYINGGAVYYYSPSSLFQITLSHNSFVNNTEGVYIEGNGNTPIALLDSNMFIRSPLHLENGIVNAQNDVISENYGGGVTIGTAGLVDATHWTVVNNNGNGITSLGMQMELTNSIIAFNNGYGLLGGGISADNILFYENGSNCGSVCTNIHLGDPKFADLDNRDYHILPGSKAQDLETNPIVAEDMDQETRPVGTGSDLGADEIPAKPEASFSSTSPQWIGSNIVFTDTSRSASGKTVLWNFGDESTSSAQNPVHQYLDFGIYTVTLKVADYGGSDEFRQEVRIFGVDFDNNNPSWVGVSEVFTNTSLVDNNTRFSWDFDDGTTSNVPEPAHQFSEPGIYTVTLTADNILGSGFASNQLTVFSVPVAGFTSTLTTGYAPFSVNFKSESITFPEGDTTLVYFWDFGDGFNSDIQNPNHVYTAPGKYPVSLTVSNSAGFDTKLQENLIIVLKRWEVFLPSIINFP